VSERVLVYEGFGGADPSSATRLHLSSAPEYWNTIRMHRVRVTIEVLEDPVEVLAARLLELWETSPYNIHHSDTYKRLSKEYGIVLPPGTRGKRAPRET